MTNINKRDNQVVIDDKLIRQYSEIMQRTPIIIRSTSRTSNLKQPSLLDTVESITTYEVAANT